MTIVKNTILILACAFGAVMLSAEPPQQSKYKLLYFGAEWCGPCQQMKKMFKDKEVAKELKRFDFKVYDEKKHPETFKKYKIRLYPTYIFERDGTIYRYTGGASKMQFLEILRKY